MAQVMWRYLLKPGAPSAVANQPPDGFGRGRYPPSPPGKMRSSGCLPGHRRPQLDACLDHLREGDVITVWKLDRLGRNTQHVLAVVDELTSRGIGFRSITEGLHTDRGNG